MSAGFFQEHADFLFVSDMMDRLAGGMTTDTG